MALVALLIWDSLYNMSGKDLVVFCFFNVCVMSLPVYIVFQSVDKCSFFNGSTMGTCWCDDGHSDYDVVIITMIKLLIMIIW